MVDLVVNLYGRQVEALGTRVAGCRAVIRAALPPETHFLTDWIEKDFSRYWVSEVQAAMAHQPPGCLIATLEGELVGFACYDTTARGFFGPTGVKEAARGQGIGLALLYHALMALKAQGFAYAFIGAAGPVDFYAQAVGAVPLPFDAGEDIYQDLLRAPAQSRGL